ncbi:MAG: trypsin-like peptidase domain-containing protein, partial [Bacteriovoracales bacterium]
MRKSISILLLSLLLSSCGKKPELSSQISESGVIVEKLDWQDLTSQIDKTPFANNSRAVGLINLSGERCTGFLIDKDLVMTNEHCIPNPGSARGVTITFGYDFQAPETNKITYQCEKFIMAHQKLDFAIVRCLPENGEFPGDHFGVVTLERKSDMEFSEVYLIQQNCPHNINSYCDPTKKIAYGKILGKEDNEFKHNADTLGGSSGSPVFSKDNHHAVALHHTGVGSIGNIGSGVGQYNLAVPMWAITSFIEKYKPELLLGIKYPTTIVSEVPPTKPEPIEVPTLVIAPVEAPIAAPLNINSNVPGESIKSAMPLERGKTSGSFKIKKSGEKHFFKVTVKSSNSTTIFKVNLKGDSTSGNLDLFLLDSSGKEIVKSTFNAADETVRILNKEGIYYIQVAGIGG